MLESNLINKRFIRFISLFIIFTMVIGISFMHAYANTSIKDGYTGGSYKYIDTKTTSLYKYKVYKYTKGGVVYYTDGQFAGKAVMHKKGSRAKTITASYNRAISWSKTTSWNASIGADFGISDNIKLSANYGYGETTGWEMESSDAVGLSTTIRKDDRTGEYAYAVGTNNYRMKYKKCAKANQDYVYCDGIFYMPHGVHVVNLVVSTDYGDSWELVEK